MSGPMWGITTYFNPSGYGTKLDNYRRFRACSAAQGLRLVTVELAFGDRPFDLESEADAEILVQRRSTSVLWQKERLLNVALDHLPSECEYVCWIDADVIFERDDWIGASVATMRETAVIQPYQYAIRLPRGGKPEQYPSSRIGWWIRRGPGLKTYSVSWCARIAERRRRPSFKGTTTGYAWCARRSLLDHCKFYDRCILGGGDREFALAVSFPPGEVPEDQVRIAHAALRRDVASWHAKVHAAAGGQTAFVPGALHHLWHGDPAKRNYVNRHDLFGQYDFDPLTDIAIDEQGCWSWSTEKQGLVEGVVAYFAARKEDG